MPHKYEVRWGRVAEEDLNAIMDYIVRDGVDLALQVLAKLRETAETLSSMQQRGRVVPELQTHGVLSYHELIFSSWRIIYRIGDRQVHVLAVFDSRRNLEDVLLERMTR